ncbi:MAG: HAD-IIIA family hydrolase [Dehalococcoidia bacterium]|nr:HAD-IIIA family hydrolase [Dehalococcoidia bacterium]
MSAAAVFFDKDGTLVDDVPYNVDPARVRLAQGAERALPAIAAASYRICVVSNQSGIARGYFDAAALARVEARLREMLAATGVALDGFACCPHHPDGVVGRYAVACACRKPAPGLITTLAAAGAIECRRSWMVGDILDDVEAGRRAGCRTVLLDNGDETEWRRSPERAPHYVARDLAHAAAIIIDGGRA